MSPNNDHGCSSSARKGKARAYSDPLPTEHTPLLTASSSSSPAEIDPEDNGPPSPIPVRHRLYRRLFLVFSITFAVCATILIVLLLVAYSYSSRASNITMEDILDRGLVVNGPDRVDVLNITEDGRIWVQVEGHMGVDAGALIGVNSADEDLVWKALWKGLGRWGVGKLERVSVDLSAIKITPRGDRDTVLATLESVPMQIQLTVDPPQDESWLTKMSFPVLITPTNQTSELVRFARDSWSTGVVNVGAIVASVAVTGGNTTKASWRNRLHLEKTNIETGIRIRIPPLPGLPSPGRQTPFPSFTELITLKSFSLWSDLDKVLINAAATFVDPAPDSLSFTAPSLSFLVSLPSTDISNTRELIPIASVNTSAFSLTHPNITLDITGHVLPISSELSPALSSFVKSYLSAESPEISISLPVFPGLTFDTIFPAPNPKPQVLRNVTIKDMKIKPSASGVMLASGLVFATAVLPKGMNVAVDVSRVFPELLVFDGPVPPDVAFFRKHDGDDEDDEADPGLPAPIPIPDPLPERAFAHIRPGDWLDALSVPINAPENGGSAVAVSAKLVDVPLEVLPGRQREFSNFIGKVIFGTEGALAGVSGIAAVNVHVQGLPIGEDGRGDMELHGLPFQGDVRIGKKTL